MTQVRIVNKRPCAMKRGEAKRVPQRGSAFSLLAYHVVCPCGFNGWVLNDGSNTITEGEGEGDVTISKPWRCMFCRAELRLTHGDLVAKADEQTRKVTYSGCPDDEDD